MSLFGGWGGGNMKSGWNLGDLKSGWGDVKGNGKWGGVAFATLGVAGLAFLARAWAADTKEAVKPAASAANSVFDSVVSGISTGIELGLLGGAALAGLKVWQTFKHEKMVCLRLKPKQKFKVNNGRVAEMVKEFRQMYHRFFWRKRVWVKWQITRNPSGMIEFRVICPKKHAGTIVKRFGNAYPDVIITEEQITVPDFFRPDRGEVAHMKLNTWPWQKERGLNAQLQNRMGDILHLMPNGSILELTFSPSSLRPIDKRARAKVEELEKRPKKGKDTAALIQLIRDRYTGNRTAFDCFIDVWSMHPVGGFLGELSAKTEGYAKLNGRPYMFLEEYRNPITWDSRFRPLVRWQSSKLTDKEIAPLFMLPEAGHPIWEYIQCEMEKPPVADSDFRGDYSMGLIDSDDPKQNGRPARLKTDCLTNHGLIAGASGGGKGSAILTFFKNDFLAKWLEDKPDGLGMTIGDPHTEVVHLILAHLLDLEAQGVEIPWHRVKVVSFGSAGAEHFPVAANLLHLPDSSSDIDRIASDAEEVILNAFDSSGLSQSAANLTRAIQGLLYLKEKTSILDIVRLFEYTPTGNALRAAVIRDIGNQNPVVAEWWRRTHEEIMKDGKDKKVAAIDTRLAPLVAKKNMQRFFCREGNYFSQIPQWLEDGCLVLIDFKGADDEMFRLCAGWLAKQYFLASQARGTGGRPHLLLFDEVQKFQASDIFFKIITENRKFGLGLILATQMVEELDDKLKVAIKSNAGFVLSVRQADGAKAMADLLGSPFTPDELKSLEKGLEAAISSFNGKARLRIDYPAYVWEGQATDRGSEQERQAKERAEAKFMELLARDHKQVSEADKEIYQFVYGTEPAAQAEAAATAEHPGNVVPMETHQGQQPSGKKRLKIK